MGGATALVLVAAALHAGWNLLVKTREDRFLALWGQFAAASIVCVPLLLVTGVVSGPLDADALLPLAASTAVHTAYIWGLARAYETGDFSMAYPVARGGGALLAAVGGTLLLDDHLSAVAWVGIAVAVAGLLALMGPSASGSAVGWACATAVAIAGYTLLDGVGARRSEGVTYGLMLFVTSLIGTSILGIATGQGPAFVRSFRGNWHSYAAGGVMSLAAYTFVLLAVRSAPIGYVAMLRESSVVLAALAGWGILREHLALARVAASTVVFSGMVLLVAGVTGG